MPISASGSGQSRAVPITAPPGRLAIIAHVGADQRIATGRRALISGNLKLLAGVRCINFQITHRIGDARSSGGLAARAALAWVGAVPSSRRAPVSASQTRWSLVGSGSPAS